MTRLAAAASVVLLAAARVAAACPLCADGNVGGGAGTSIWTAVGVFLFVPPILGFVVVAAMRRETRGQAGAPSRGGVPRDFVRFRRRDAEPDSHDRDV